MYDSLYNESTICMQQIYEKIQSGWVWALSGCRTYNFYKLVHITHIISSDLISSERSAVIGRRHGRLDPPLWSDPVHRSQHTQFTWNWIRWGDRFGYDLTSHSTQNGSFGDAERSQYLGLLRSQMRWTLFNGGSMRWCNEGRLRGRIVVGLMCVAIVTGKESANTQ